MFMPDSASESRKQLTFRRFERQMKKGKLLSEVHDKNDYDFEEVEEFIQEYIKSRKNKSKEVEPPKIATEEEKEKTESPDQK